MQVLDFGQQCLGVGKRKPHKLDPDGWYRVAWGFVRPVEPSGGEDETLFDWRLDGTLKRLQLWRYSEMPTYKVDDSPAVWQQWQSGWRERYKSTIYVTLGMAARQGMTKVCEQLLCHTLLCHTLLCCCTAERCCAVVAKSAGCLHRLISWLFTQVIVDNATRRTILTQPTQKEVQCVVGVCLQSEW